MDRHNQDELQQIRADFEAAAQASSAAFGTSVTAGEGALTGIAGLYLGNAEVDDTGVTVLATPEGAVAAVDVRGGGPGTRETDLLSPENTVERAHAIVLSGGSAFGLAAADGVMRELADRSIGYQVAAARPEILVPIVPGAVIFDLLVGDPTLPDASLGRAVLCTALADDTSFHSGSYGAGRAASAGAIKGGVGQAKVTAPGGLFVAAVMVANPFGAVVDSGGVLYGNPALPGIRPEALSALTEKFIGVTKAPRSDAAPSQSRNTTIGCVITNAPLTSAQAKRIAMCAHDGLARAIRPAHAPMDGDTIFCLSLSDSSTAETPVSPQQIALLTAMAADAVQFAIVDAVISAESVGVVPAWRDLT